MAEWEEEGWRRLSGVVVEEEAEGVVRITSVARGNGALATSCSGDLNDLALLSLLPAQDLQSSSSEALSCLLLLVADPGQAAWNFFFFF